MISNPRPRCWLLLVPLVLAVPASGAEVLDDFPLTVICGNPLGTAGEPATPGRLLPDRPFSPERGYGYVGGHASSRRGARALGGPADWPLSSREDPRRYTFHLPDDTYRVELWFLETDVAVPGLRRFDVVAEDVVRLEDVDIARDAGDYRWIRRSLVVPVRDGWLDLVFETGEGEAPLPPRVSRIVIHPHEAKAPSPAPLELTARPRPGRIHLEWKLPEVDPAGYAIFRSPERAGPYRSLTEYPLHVPFFEDHDVDPGAEYHYRVRTLELDGNQGPLSEPVSATASGWPDDGLPHLRLTLSETARAMLGQRLASDRRVEAELTDGQAERRVWLRVKRDVRSWQARKSYEIDVRGRSFLGMDTFHLDADLGDATFLRERLFHRAHELAGLAALRVLPVHLSIDGEYRGVTWMREGLRGPFRKRHRLDRIGNFASLTDPGQLALDWSPPGHSLEPEGSLWSLTEFLHEIHRLEEGESEAHFESRFYLDRILRRLALAAILGGSAFPDPPRVYLGDSRNGRWEFFTPRAPAGTLGIHDFQGLPPGEVTVEEARRDLAVGSLAQLELPALRFDPVVTRILARPAPRARFLETVEGLLDKELSPESVATTLDMWNDEREALLADAARLFADPAMLRQAPAAVLAHYRSRVRALREAIRSERDRAPEPLVLNEIFLDPGFEEGEVEVGPFIEVANRSSQPVDLAKYRLALDSALRHTIDLPTQTLAPGACLAIPVVPGEGTRGKPGEFRPSATGGRILLVRSESGRGRFRVADVIHHGQQTPGRSYGRSGAGGDRWGHRSKPDPDAPNEGELHSGPPWRYRWKIDRVKERDLLVWIRVPGEVASIELLFRPPELEDYRPLTMEYAKERHRHEIFLPGGESLVEIPFYFRVRNEAGVERPFPLTGRDLTFAIPGNPPLFINEVLPRPSDDSPHGEFIEIYNAGEVPISVEGMFLSDSKKNSRKWRLPVEEPIPPGGFLVVYGDGKGEGLHAPFKLGNSGDYLALFHRLDAGNVRVDHIAFAAVPTDRSWGRRKDGKKGGRFWKDPTPGARNLPKIPEEYLREQREAAESRREEREERKGPPLPDFGKKDPDR